MKKILIYCNDAIANAIQANIAAIAAAANISDDDLRFEVNDVKAQPRAGQARVHYRGVFPNGATVDQIRGLIMENTKAFGSVTMKAIVYRDLAEATLAGHLRGKREIVEAKKLTASTVEREIGFLLKGGFIASEPIAKV